MNKIAVNGSQLEVIYTASDPRQLDDFSTLREQINKINHPARPEVNWRLIESLSLSLFRDNGVDLQTAVYYSLARTKLHGLQGFTDGAELLAALIVGRWDSFWPENEHARVEILEWYNGRVGSYLRQNELSVADLPLVYRAERALQLITDKLQQQPELNRIPRIANLLFFISNSAKKLEQEKKISAISPAKAQQITPLVYSAETAPSIKKAPVAARPAPKLDSTPPVIVVEQIEPQKSRPAWQGFILGVIIAWGIGAFALWIWLMSAQPQSAIFAATESLVAPLSAEQIEALRNKYGYSSLTKLADQGIAAYGQRLEQIETYSPLYWFSFSDRLLQSAQLLWPKEVSQSGLIADWQARRSARLAPLQKQYGHYQAQQRLSALLDELIVEEGKKGGFLTITHLKTEIGVVQRLLSTATPLEDLLYQLGQQKVNNIEPSADLKQQIERKFNMLLTQYYQLQAKQAAANRSPTGLKNG